MFASLTTKLNKVKNTVSLNIVFTRVCTEFQRSVGFSKMTLKTNSKKAPVCIAFTNQYINRQVSTRIFFKEIISRRENTIKFYHVPAGLVEVWYRGW